MSQSPEKDPKKSLEKNNEHDSSLEIHPPEDQGDPKPSSTADAKESEVREDKGNDTDKNDKKDPSNEKEAKEEEEPAEEELEEEKDKPSEKEAPKEGPEEPSKQKAPAEQEKKPEAPKDPKEVQKEASQKEDTAEENLGEVTIIEPERGGQESEVAGDKDTKKKKGTEDAQTDDPKDKEIERLKERNQELLDELERSKEALGRQSGELEKSKKELGKTGEELDKNKKELEASMRERENQKKEFEERIKNLENENKKEIEKMVENCSNFQKEMGELVGDSAEVEAPQENDQFDLYLRESFRKVEMFKSKKEDEMKHLQRRIEEFEKELEKREEMLDLFEEKTNKMSELFVATMEELLGVKKDQKAFIKSTGEDFKSQLIEEFVRLETKEGEIQPEKSDESGEEKEGQGKQEAQEGEGAQEAQEGNIDESDGRSAEKDNTEEESENISNDKIAFLEIMDPTLEVYEFILNLVKKMSKQLNKELEDNEELEIESELERFRYEDEVEVSVAESELEATVSDVSGEPGQPVRAPLNKMGRHVVNRLKNKKKHLLALFKKKKSSQTDRMLQRICAKVNSEEIVQMDARVDVESLEFYNLLTFMEEEVNRILSEEKKFSSQLIRENLNKFGEELMKKKVAEYTGIMNGLEQQMTEKIRVLEDNKRELAKSIGMFGRKSEKEEKEEKELEEQNAKLKSEIEELEEAVKRLRRKLRNADKDPEFQMSEKGQVEYEKDWERRKGSTNPRPGRGEGAAQGNGGLRVRQGAAVGRKDLQEVHRRDPVREPGEAGVPGGPAAV